MTLKAVLTVSAIYQAIVGVGMMLAPRQFGIDAVPPDASPELVIGNLEIPGRNRRDP